MKMPPSLLYCALLALELGFTFLLFDPASTKVQTGLMLIFALEIAFAIRIAKVQLYLKQTNRPLLIGSRAYAAVYVMGMLVALFTSLGMLPFTEARWVMAGAFIVAASGKLLWERHFGSYVALAPASNRWP